MTSISVRLIAILFAQTDQCAGSGVQCVALARFHHLILILIQTLESGDRIWQCTESRYAYGRVRELDVSGGPAEPSAALGVSRASSAAMSQITPITSQRRH
ncbi:hypothetical protein M8818_001665 [Zalaria obscura]|uniref:Uncharacterized protein n=1 Tax=Zalaria obscura TaxID=2024903 RepID=A0ACC3SM83_9PEZI